MRMNDAIKPKKQLPTTMNRGVLIGIGVGLIVISLVALALSAWEGFFKSGKIQLVNVPGFQEIQLEEPGLYGGLYQHQGNDPLPVEFLQKLDVRILSKGDYEEIPVLMNTQGQTFERLGMRGMPVFNFVVEYPGTYTISAVSTGPEPKQPLPLFLIPQTTQNIKQTLIVGIGFFLLFLASGVFVLVRVNRWAPKS